MSNIAGERRSGLVIVEGTCGSGKSTLLASAPRMFAEREVRLFTQKETYGPIVRGEDDGTLDDALDHLILSQIVERIERELRQAGRLVLVDTLHATHMVRAGVLSARSFDAIDREVSQLRPLVVVLRVSEDSIRARTVVGRRGTDFSRYARKFGETDDELTGYFLEEQRRIIEVLERSRRRPVVLDGDAPPGAVGRRFAGIVRDYLGVSRASR